MPGIRPPLVRVETADRLADYLGFRHVFRNLYAFNLRWLRVRELAAATAPLWADVRADLEAFVAFLDAVGAEAMPQKSD